MAKGRSSPWASGPRELLEHAIELLKRDTDSRRRFAMIFVDNAVELTIKTFLGLPKRVTGIHIPRSKFQEIADSFPSLIDALEQHAGSRLDGINLGEIEWYHRLRNQLYHDGNGLTVEREKVDTYSLLAGLLLAQLLDEDISPAVRANAGAIGEFIQNWASLESELIVAAKKLDAGKTGSFTTLRAARLMRDLGQFDEETYLQLRKLMEVRNTAVHQPDRTSHGELKGALEETRKFRLLLKPLLP